MYIAHKNEASGEVQTVKAHCENTAALCRQFAIPALKEPLYVMGLLHDIGKYQPSFQERINGSGILVEHAGCGAVEARVRFGRALGLLMSYCIMGHHSGIPDAGSFNDTPDMSTLYGRLKRKFEDYSVYKDQLDIPPVDDKAFVGFLLRDCGNDRELLADKFAFFVRYCFSCLTDADWLDTADFCNGAKEQENSLGADFVRCLEKLNGRLGSFSGGTALQQARARLQRQVFDRVGEDADIYLMNMPTGSGKTLCSMKFALERALAKDYERIIYVIPYNSIIDQTASVMEELFGPDAELLRHQSTFSYEDREDYSEDYRQTAKLAAENWDARLIITTAVQFFESIYDNRRGKLRKLHNMADSVLIFDEAHLMPQNYLQPCLRAISYITKYLNSEAVFLTATMPDFKQLISQYALPSSTVLDLVEDRTEFVKFKKCAYRYIGRCTQEALAGRAGACPSALIVVNKRRTAKELYSLCTGKKFHLSTYMTAFDRKRVIDDIGRELAGLERDYPGLENVPPERRVTVVSTSLIEAGVDLDFYAVFRELSGLDHILQAGGRCNREGKREKAETVVFELEQEGPRRATDEQTNITRRLLTEYEDISCPACIREYYELLFFLKREELTSNTITRDGSDIGSLAFREYAKQFELIDSKTVSVAVQRDETSRRLIESIRVPGLGKGRKLQQYAFTVYQYEFDELCRQGVVDDFGSGIWCLTNPDYYDPETGVTFEAKDYFL